MNKQAIPMFAAIAIAAVVLTSLAILSEQGMLPGPTNVPESFGNWECSGPICIRPTEVRLGENIYITGNDMSEDEIIRLAITNPSGKVWEYIYTDGSKKANWNFYIKPDYSLSRDFCTLNDLVGLWTIELHGTNYESLRFQHGPVILEGSEKHYTPERNVCP